MAQELQSLTPNCGGLNIAGIIKIEYFPIDWIAVFPEFIADNNTITTPLSLIAGKSPLTMGAVPESIDYKERQRNTKQGPFNRQDFKLEVVTDNGFNNHQFNIMKRYRFVIVYTYYNGTRKLLGSPEYPFKFESSLESGKKPGGFLGYKLAFTSQNPEKAPFITVDIT